MCIGASFLVFMIIIFERKKKAGFTFANLCITQGHRKEEHLWDFPFTHKMQKTNRFSDIPSTGHEFCNVLLPSSILRLLLPLINAAFLFTLPHQQQCSKQSQQKSKSGGPFGRGASETRLFEVWQISRVLMINETRSDFYRFSHFLYLALSFFCAEMGGA